MIYDLPDKFGCCPRRIWSDFLVEGFFLAQLGKKNVFFVYVCRHNTKHN